MALNKNKLDGAIHEWMCVIIFDEFIKTCEHLPRIELEYLQHYVRNFTYRLARKREIQVQIALKRM